MNTERITEVADLIEAGHEKLHFQMETWGCPASEHEETAHLCGTAACIAGWTYARFGATGNATKVDHRRPALNEDRVLDCATAVLGLTNCAAASLFIPRGFYDGISVREVTADHAVRTLRHLAKTGEVDWRATNTADA